MQLQAGHWEAAEDWRLGRWQGGELVWESTARGRGLEANRLGRSLGSTDQGVTRTNGFDRPGGYHN